VLVVLGGGLLGYIAGEMAVEDPVVHPWFTANAPDLAVIIPLVGFAVVAAAGTWLKRRHLRARSSP